MAALCQCIRHSATLVIAMGCLGGGTAEGSVQEQRVESARQKMLDSVEQNMVQIGGGAFKMGIRLRWIRPHRSPYIR